MFKVEIKEEREAIEVMRNHKMSVHIKNIIKRELDLHHKRIESELDTNATNIYKGGCRVLRGFYSLFESEDKIEDFVEVPEKKKLPVVKEYGILKRIIKYFKQKPDTHTGPVK